MSMKGFRKVIIRPENQQLYYCYTTLPMENQTGRLIPNQSFNTYLTRFQSGGYQIDAYQLFSLYLQLGFRSESEQPNWNRVIWLMRMLKFFITQFISHPFFSDFITIHISLRSICIRFHFLVFFSFFIQPFLNLFMVLHKKH